MNFNKKRPLQHTPSCSKSPATKRVSDFDTPCTPGVGSKPDRQSNRSAQIYLQEALKNMFTVDPSSSVSRSEVEESVMNWLREKYTDLPFNLEEAVHSRKLGFAISTVFDFHIRINHGSYRSMRKLPHTAVETPLAVPLQSTPQTTPMKEMSGGVRRALLGSMQIPEAHLRQSESKTLPPQKTQFTQTMRSDFFSSFSRDQEEELSQEIVKFQQFCKTSELGSAAIDYSSLEDVIDELSFSSLCDQVISHCPLLTAFMRVFVESKEERKIKTASEKLLRIVHANGLLIKLGHQRSSGFALHFGILCVSFGCGEEGEELHEHRRIWESAKDSYLLKIIRQCSGIRSLQLDSLHHSDLEKMVNEMKDKKNKATLVNVMEEPCQIPRREVQQPKIIHYPICLANCGTIDGNVKILAEFARTLALENCKDDTFALTFSEKNRNYDLKASREKRLFIDKMTKVIATEDSEPENDDDRQEDDQSNTGCERDDHFDIKYKEIRQMLLNATNSKQLSDISELHDAYCCDKYGRSYLHLAAEFNHIDMVQFLFFTGFNPNAVENIGITPLSVAVIAGNTNVVEILLSKGADCKFGIPSAYSVCTDIGNTEILTIFDKHVMEYQAKLKKLYGYCGVSIDSRSEMPSCPALEEQFSFSRTKFKVPIFGDNGVEKQIRSIKTKSGKFSQFLECPGDLHAYAYACECMAKCLGGSGMYHCLAKELKRKNNSDTFGSLKMQEGNLQSNAEACSDIAFGFGLALYFEYCNSEYFPHEKPDDEQMIFDRFKLFIKDMQGNKNVAHYLQAVTLFGPWLTLYKQSTRLGYGIGREVSWHIGLLVYGPMSKTNYFCSALVHCVNFNYAWPPVVRQIVRDHSSVSVSGGTGHMLAVDDYVESRLVKPLKMYVTGHTTVKMLKMLSGNSRVIYQVRNAYLNAFSGGRNKGHKTPDALLDQLKVASFATKEGFFRKDLTAVYLYGDTGQTNKTVNKSLYDVVERGQEMLNKKFEQKMYTYFAVWRKKHRTENLSQV